MDAARRAGLVQITFATQQIAVLPRHVATLTGESARLPDESV
jgi:hypothetical protein